jgi:hypothetical protein
MRRCPICSTRRQARIVGGVSFNRDSEDRVYDYVAGVRLVAPMA